MRKIHLRLSQKIWLTILVLSLAVNIGLSIYERVTDTYFYFHILRSGPVHLLLAALSAVAALVCLLWLVKNEMVKAFSIAGAMILAFFLPVLLGTGLYFGDYYTYTSPDGTYSLVGCEERFGFHSGILRLYRAENPFFIRGVFRDSYNDYVHPFRDGETVVDWQSDRAVIYLFGADSPADDIVTVYFDE